MTNQKNNFDDSAVKVDYVEEVSEDQLYDKKNQSDIIYVEDSNSESRNKVVLVFIFILILLSLFSIVFGLVFSNNAIERDPEVITYDLFVTHSNSNYGGIIDSFKEYSSADVAYNYNFTVSNTNSVDLGYKIQVENPNFDTDGVDMSLISYSLMNNQKEIMSGNFTDKKVLDLSDVKISANSNDQLVLKIWSSQIDENLKFTFKVNVVEEDV